MDRGATMSTSDRTCLFNETADGGWLVGSDGLFVRALVENPSTPGLRRTPTWPR